MQESYILTPRELHFGHIKETFGKGAVITVDRERRMLIIDGRKFDDTRDLDVLIRQAAKFPDKPWIVPYSEENLEVILSQRADRKVQRGIEKGLWSGTHRHKDGIRLALQNF